MPKRDRRAPFYDQESSFKNIQVGDIIFDECEGPCSGGYRYDIGETVVSKKGSIIRTSGGQEYDVVKDVSSKVNRGYYIFGWQKGKQRKVYPNTKQERATLSNPSRFKR